MIAREARWADLGVGSYLKDKNGKTWKVTSDIQGEFDIVDRDGKVAVLKPRPADTAVTIVVPAPDAGEAILITELGASVMGRVHKGAEVWACAPFATGTSADMMAHLQAFHRVAYDEAPPLAELVQMHDLTHLDPKTGHTPHHHEGV